MAFCAKNLVKLWRILGSIVGVSSGTVASPPVTTGHPTTHRLDGIRVQALENQQPSPIGPFQISLADFCLDHRRPVCR